MSLFAEYLSTLSGGGGGGSTIVVLADATVFDSNPSLADAIYTITSTGDVQRYTTLNGTEDIGDWISPKSSAPGAYEVRADVVFGTISGAATGSWLALTSSRSWVVDNTSPGTVTARMTVSIRLAGSVLTTATVNFTAKVFPAEPEA